MKTIGSVFAALFFLFLIMAASNSTTPQTPAPTYENQAQATLTSRAALYPDYRVWKTSEIKAAFADNEISAEATFKGVTFFSGIVTSIETGAFSGAWITVDGIHYLDYEDLGIRCDVSAKVMPSMSQLHRWSKVTISGMRARKVMGQVFFDDCMLEPFME